jgi:hypothetical protein
MHGAYGRKHDIIEAMVIMEVNEGFLRMLDEFVIHLPGGIGPVYKEVQCPLAGKEDPFLGFFY